MRRVMRSSSAGSTANGGFTTGQIAGSTVPAVRAVLLVEGSADDGPDSHPLASSVASRKATMVCAAIRGRPLIPPPAAIGRSNGERHTPLTALSTDRLILQFRGRSEHARAPSPGRDVALQK